MQQIVADASFVFSINTAAVLPRSAAARRGRACASLVKVDRFLLLHIEFMGTTFPEYNEEINTGNNTKLIYCM